jgi:hypothetical protein
VRESCEPDCTYDENVQMIDEPNVLSTRSLGWRVWLPALLMTAIAVVQIVLATTADISAWKGGGFGMFATVDGPSTRRVRIFVDGPGRSEEIDLAPSQQVIEKRTRLFPSDLMLSSLAKAVAEREKRSGRPVSTVRLEVWRADYNDKLEGTDRPLRTFSWNVDQETHDTR